jgi:hypothetical protein
MRGQIVRGNPYFEPHPRESDVLDEIRSAARRSIEPFAMIGLPIIANRMLHSL